MINFFGRFLPFLSNKTVSLRALTHSKSDWNWDFTNETAWNELNEWEEWNERLVSEVPVFKFYDQKVPIKISADASKEGIGTVLLQWHYSDWRPVAYAARAMVPAETRYAQNEKELWATVYASKRFHQYIYRQSTEFESNHKPLMHLFKKQLNNCP